MQCSTGGYNHFLTENHAIIGGYNHAIIGGIQEDTTTHLHEDM